MGFCRVSLVRTGKLNSRFFQMLWIAARMHQDPDGRDCEKHFAIKVAAVTDIQANEQCGEHGMSKNNDSWQLELTHCNTAQYQARLHSLFGSPGRQYKANDAKFRPQFRKQESTIENIEVRPLHHLINYYCCFGVSAMHT